MKRIILLGLFLFIGITLSAQNKNAKPYAFQAGEKALNEALSRRKEIGTASLIKGLSGVYSIRYNIDNNQKVSIIIPTKNQAKILRQCLFSIFTKSTYSNFEIIIINNGSTEKDFFELISEYETKYKSRINCIDLNIPFNFSKIVNYGASHSTGDYLLLLNNDIEVITPDWIEAMMEQAQRQSIGAVGVKLCYPNDTIQHAGVVIGFGGAAGHTFVGEQKDADCYFYYTKSIRNYSSVTAACIMVRNEVFNLVNGFDNKLSVEYNDVDFCLKLKEKGFNNIYLPHVSLYHYESLSRKHPYLTRCT